MKLYMQIIKLLFNKFILRKSNGIVIKNFAEKMGIVYIKLAQILSTHNFGNVFTEEDRQMLSNICDSCNPISYDEIEAILKQEYGTDLENIFSFIEKDPVGSASVSQVHRAVLKTGEEVAIKIKRKDITITIEKDIKQIRKVFHRFAKFVNIYNFIGGDHALDLYLSWIREEIDFFREIENIKLYNEFANSVNGKVSNTKQIKVPKIYEKYCTENIIVMEFIKDKTINKIELTNENEEMIATALNSYISLSFWAMFNDEKVVFHGDPHSGNICIDEDGNICFLDMGLVFLLSDSDSKMCRDFFLTIISGNYKKLYDILLSYSKISEQKGKQLEEDCKKYCTSVREKEVTDYYIDLMAVCLKYEIDPPVFLYNIAKAMLCLNGINKFSNNRSIAKELLKQQTVEFIIKRSIGDLEKIAKDTFNIVPNAFKNTIQYGMLNTIAQVITSSNIINDVGISLENLKETLDLIKVSCCDEISI